MPNSSNGSETIRLHHDMDRLKLAETHAVIRNPHGGAHLVHSPRRPAARHGRLFRRRTAPQPAALPGPDIARHALKAQESEHMKSIFVNTICRRIGPPLGAIDQTATMR